MGFSIKAIKTTTTTTTTTTNKTNFKKAKQFIKCNLHDVINMTDVIFGKWFEPRGISYLSSMIIWVRVVFRKTCW